MVTKKNQKPKKKFHCIICDFKCNNKRDYERHEGTRKHKNNKNVIAIDIRILFSKKENLKMLFDDNICNINSIDEIKKLITSVKNKNNLFRNHYEFLKADYERLMKLTNETFIDREELNIMYPWKIVTNENSEIQWSTFYSGILEMYTICQILLSDNKYVFNYLGAAHCATIFKLLTTYYGYDIKKNNNLMLNVVNTISYKKFESLGDMCSDFKI